MDEERKRICLEELTELTWQVRQSLETWKAVGLRGIRVERGGPDWPSAASPQDARPVQGPRQDRGPQAPAQGRRDTRRTTAPAGQRAAGERPAQPAPSPRPSSGGGAAGRDRWAGYGSPSAPPAALTEIRRRLGDCGRCPLARTRRNIVFGTGSPRADLVVVGEAPGASEDERGEPFVGRAGQMLTRMLENVLHLGRNQVYIMNVLKCRPPGNRDPMPGEIRACRPFFDAQLDVIRPRVILALGRYATQSLLDTGRGIKALRGSWGMYRGVPVMPTFHPAYLLRNEAEKRRTWDDLLAVERRLAGKGT